MKSECMRDSLRHFYVFLNSMEIILKDKLLKKVGLFPTEV